MPTIEFLFFAGCPSHAQALALLREVMAEQGVDSPVTIIPVETDAAAQLYAFHGSPTIRVDGVDIAPVPESVEPGLACRAYRTADGRLSPLPPRELIVAALAR